MPGVESIIVRFADDIIIGFEHEGEARRFLADMRQRMEKFALSLHPDKTRLIEFGRYAAGHPARRGLGKPVALANTFSRSDGSTTGHLRNHRPEVNREFAGRIDTRN